MTLSSRKYKGEFTKRILVTTNDPDHPKETLFCKGSVRRPVNVDPQRINLGQISRKSGPVTKTVVITSGDAGPLKPELQPTTDPAIETRLKEILPGARYELQVTVSPPFKSDQVRTNLTLSTGVSKSPTVSIPLFGTLAPKVSPRPRHLRVPAERESGWEQAVSLIWDGDETHRILGATANDPDLKLRVEEQDGRQQVIVEVPADYKRQSGTRTVTIRTDDDETPQVSVPVTFTTPRKTRPGATARRTSAAKLTPKATATEAKPAAAPPDTK